MQLQTSNSEWEMLTLFPRTFSNCLCTTKIFRQYSWQCFFLLSFLRLYEDGTVGKHSLCSYGSVGQEVKRCRHKAIFCRLYWQEYRASVVNGHCEVSLVPLPNCQDEFNSGEKSVHLQPQRRPCWPERLMPSVTVSYSSKLFRFRGKVQRIVPRLSEPVRTSPGNVCPAGAASTDSGLGNFNHPTNEAAWATHVQARTLFHSYYFAAVYIWHSHAP